MRNATMNMIYYMSNTFEDADLDNIGLDDTGPESDPKTNEGEILLGGGVIVPHGLPETFGGGFTDDIPPLDEALNAYQLTQQVPSQPTNFKKIQQAANGGDYFERAA